MPFSETEILTMLLLGYEAKRTKIISKMEEITRHIGPPSPRRKFTKATRARMAEAQRKRWAKRQDDGGAVYGGEQE